jgi:hypothetical protein
MISAWSWQPSPKSCSSIKFQLRDHKYHKTNEFWNPATSANIRDIYGQNFKIQLNDSVMYL